MSTNQVVVTVRQGEQYKHQIVAWQKLAFEEYVPPTPGIYSWHFRLRPGADEDYRQKVVGALLEALTHIPMKLRGRMNFGVRHVGELARVATPLPAVDDELPSALMMIPLPLYIGMSTNLHSRLCTHKKSVLEAIDQPGAHVKRRVASDSDAESSLFGSRVGKFLARSNLRPADVLYVRYFELPRAESESVLASRLRLLSIERTLNLLHTPVFGRR